MKIHFATIRGITGLRTGSARPDHRAIFRENLLGPAPVRVAPATAESGHRGTFRQTGSMTSARVGHSATLLLDGRVLIAGGCNGLDEWANILASAELYDPSTGTFSRTGSMTATRLCHSATLLLDGRVLIVGGADGGSAELFDPETGTFRRTGSMTTTRTNGHTATLLSDGRVLIVGGTDGGSAELYDPETGTFRRTDPVTTARTNGHTATLLSDGRVLIAGGNGVGPSGPIASAELYQP